MGMKPSISPGPTGESDQRSGDAPRAGILIVNADDWGRDHENTERTLECIGCGTVSSVSGMVFMKDSERAAQIAREQAIDAGLHLNFTTAFSAPDTPARLLEHQRRLAQYLLGNRFAQIIFHPGLASSFDYVMGAQLQEFRRIYGAQPERLDGHHHMHLCANVILGKMLPAGTVVRRNFSFQPGEKSLLNRLYRKAVDHRLARRHRLADFLFSLPPLEPPGRLERIRSLARQYVVEVETHPVKADEYRFLTGTDVAHWAQDVPIASRFTIPLGSPAASKGGQL